MTPDKKVGNAPGLYQSFKAVALSSCAFPAGMLASEKSLKVDDRDQRPPRIHSYLLGVSFCEEG
jgi:hypothetical protein